MSETPLVGGDMNVVGITVFTLFVVAALALLAAVLATMNGMSVRDGTVAHTSRAA